MPAISTVTRQEVVEAAQDIITGGRQVSGGSLRRQVGRGDPRRLMALWVEHQAGGAPAEDAPAAAPAMPLPPALVELEATLHGRVTAELSTVLAAAWATAERLAGERLAGEIAAARAAADTARAQADEMGEALGDADVVAAGHTQALEAAERRAVAAETLTEEHGRRLKETEARLEREWKTAMEEETQKRRRLESELLTMRDARLAAETLAEERGRMLNLLAPSPVPIPVADVTEPETAEAPRRKRQQSKDGDQPAAA